MELHDRVRVPLRKELLAELDEIRRRTLPLFVVWPLLTLTALWFTNYDALFASVYGPLILVGFAAQPWLSALIYWAGRQRRAVDDLRPDSQIGLYTKADLQKLIAEVHAKLGVPPMRVYITRDKDLNASVMMIGLGRLFPGLECVYVHRRMLFVLRPDELASVIGHELGHYNAHNIPFERAGLFHFALLLAGGMCVYSNISDMTYGLIAAAVVGWLQEKALARLIGDHSESIEFLCDDFGARASGLVPAINTELKLAHDREVALRAQATLHQIGPDLPLRTLLAVYEEAVPYGVIDEQALAVRMADGVRAARKKSRQISASGYWDFLQPDTTDIDEDYKKLTRIDRLPPTIPWDRSPLLGAGLDRSAIERLVVAAVDHPDQLLFALPEELGTRTGAHPTATRRVLFLWRNRDDSSS